MSGPWSNPCFKSMCQIREPNPRRLSPCSTVRVCVATGVFQSGTFQICKRKSSLFGEKYKKDIPAMGNKGFLRYGRIRKGNLILRSFRPFGLHQRKCQVRGPIRVSNPCVRSESQIRGAKVRVVSPIVETEVFQKWNVPNLQTQIFAL